MLDQILPKGIVVVGTRSDRDVQLFREERWIVRHAIESRRREFTTARFCAREALAQIGFSRQAIPAGPHGDPKWPAGIVGSITHCDGYRAAAVSRTQEFATIGIDAEPNQPLPEGVLKIIASPEELAWLQPRMRDQPAICWDRLLFSAKEAVYKAWFTLTSETLGFENATITIRQSSQRFSARPPIGGSTGEGWNLSSLSGRWLVRDGFVITAATLLTT